MRLAAMMPALLMLTTALLAGCAGGAQDGGDGKTTTTSASASTTPASNPCPVTAVNVVPGYTANGGQWGQVAAAEGRTDVVCGHADKALSTLVLDAGNHTDLALNVSFNMQAGDSGAGVVLHYQDAQNYNIVRYSPREQGWHVFTVIAGNRQKQDEGSVTPPTTNPELDQWVELRVRSVGGHLEAWDGSVKVIDYQLPEGAARWGKAGLFLRDSGMAAYFDDLRVQPA